jgi:hypothetical protein
MKRAFLFLFAAIAVLVSVPARAFDVYTSCDVDSVGAWADRVHVRCNAPYPGSTIYYFAVPATAREMASRVEAIGLVAQVTGANVRIYFNLADTSGSSFGCAAGDCRTVSGLEVTGVGPLASAPASSMLGSVAMLTLPEPGVGLEVAASSIVLGTLAVRRRRARIRRDAARSS